MMSTTMMQPLDYLSDISQHPIPSHHRIFHAEPRPTKRNRGTGSSPRTCHDQLLAAIHRLFIRLHASSKWLYSCRSSANTADDPPAPFHDTPGVDLSAKEVGNDNPRIFSFAELYIGTNGFSKDQVLGSGGFGLVYRGVLPSDGTVVAVKCLAQRGEHFEKTFAAELVAVAHLRHRNLVRLRGWCVHDSQLLLVYDYMPNRSLDRVLFRNQEENIGKVGGRVGIILDWERRKKIVRGLAAALFYLHEQLETQIIHRDVKTSNVMLDFHFNARLGDFGLARWLEHNLVKEQVEEVDAEDDYSNQHQIRTHSMRNYHHRFRLADTTRIGGTIGYLPPESFRKRYVATAKSDVFSFGIVVLEVATGRRAVDLAQVDEQIVLLDWVRRLADEGKLLQAGDSRIPDDGSCRLSDMEVTIHLGLLCTMHDPKLRPDMRWVTDIVSGNYLGKLPALPSFKSHPLYISLSSPSSTTSRSNNSNSQPTTITISSASTGKTAPTVYITATGNTIFVTAEEDGENQRDTGSTDGIRRQEDMNPLLPVVETPREISYKEIISATNNFSEDRRVAEVDFGTAFYGILDGRHHVIVKRLGMKTCPALRARFSTELQNLGRLRHRNLVQLRGWCTEQGEMLVVYDYSVSRLLSNLLFHRQRHGNDRPHKLLRWPQRYNIIKALASAILYLHEEWDEQVIHRHITSASIALDAADMNPRLTSFALAEFLTRNEHGNPHAVIDKKKSVRGIFGYMSPEYMETGEANTAADIYSFGVVVLEVISGQMAVDFRRPEVLLVKRVHAFEVKKRALEELVDQELDGEYDRRELMRLVKIGVACTRSDPDMRPNIRQIVSKIDGNDSCLIEGQKEGTEKWRQRNHSHLSLIRRIQALGIQ